MEKDPARGPPTRTRSAPRSRRWRGHMRRWPRTASGPPCSPPARPRRAERDDLGDGLDALRGQNGPATWPPRGGAPAARRDAGRGSSPSSSCLLAAGGAAGYLVLKAQETGQCPNVVGRKSRTLERPRNQGISRHEQARPRKAAGQRAARDPPAGTKEKRAAGGGDDGVRRPGDRGGADVAGLSQRSAQARDQRRGVPAVVVSARAAVPKGKAVAPRTTAGNRIGRGKRVRRSSRPPAVVTSPTK